MQNKSNILVVSSEIKRNKYSSSLTTFKFIEQASKYYTIDVLTEPMSTFDFESLINELIITDYKGHKGILFYKILNRLNKFLFKTNIYRKLRLRAFNRTLLKIDFDKYDYVFAFGGGDFFEPLEALAKVEKIKTPRIGYVHDPFPFHFFPKPYEEKPTRRSLNHEYKLRKAFNNLEKLAFPSKLLSDWMGERYQINREKRVIIPHGIPLISVSDNNITDEVDLFIEKYQLNEGFYFHAGTLLYHRRIDYLVDAFKMFKKGKDNKKIKLLHIGNMQYSYNNSEEDVIIINDRLDLNFVNILAKKSLGLIIIEHIGKISPFLPGKFPEYISLKKPIMHFGPNNSEIVRIIQEYYPNVASKVYSAELNDTDGIFDVFISGGILLNDSSLWDYFHFRPDNLMSN
jgi:glycosyltransferase involved in cell wall biosynthesis